MSIRSTNVYEERSLGVYEPDDTPADEPTLVGDKSEVFRYAFPYGRFSTLLHFTIEVERLTFYDQSSS